MIRKKIDDLLLNFRVLIGGNNSLPFKAKINVLLYVGRPYDDLLADFIRLDINIPGHCGVVLPPQATFRKARIPRVLPVQIDGIASRQIPIIVYRNTLVVNDEAYVGDACISGRNERQRIRTFVERINNRRPNNDGRLIIRCR